jgi:sugar phosphate isomerase/epimerase
MHPRVCLHQVGFLKERTAEFVTFCREIGMPQMTLVTPMLFQPGESESAIERMVGGDTHVAVLNHPVAMSSNLELVGSEESDSLLRAIDIAAAMRARVIYLVSGGRGSLDWETAAQRFASIVAPCLEPAHELGVDLLVETASSLNVDIHLAHTFDDTIRLAEIAGIGVCIDLHACWFEAGLKEKMARAMPMTGLVQVSDYVAGDRTTPCRAVPGDGIIPLERLIADVLDAGYSGVFDLELVGPRIEQEGPHDAGRRAAENLSEILIRLRA